MQLPDLLLTAAAGSAATPPGLLLPGLSCAGRSFAWASLSPLSYLGGGTLTILTSTPPLDLGKIYTPSSTARTTDDIVSWLQRYCPDTWSIVAREPVDPFPGPWPLVQVLPLDQKVFQEFIGLAGNGMHTPDTYVIKYVGLTAQDLGCSAQEAQDRYWIGEEILLRALRKSWNMNLGGSVIRLADEMHVRYTEDGAYIKWRNTPRVGGIMLVSVQANYRTYGM